MIKVLFVCVGNTCRSQLAEAFARRLGVGVLDVHSAGTAPKDAVDPRAIAALQQRGYDVNGAAPKSIDAVPPGPYEWMIRMGCGDVLLVPALHREDWDSPAPSQLPDCGFEALCNELEDRVRNLVARAQAWADATGFVVARPSSLPEVPSEARPPASAMPSGDGALTLSALAASPVSSPLDAR